MVLCRSQRGGEALAPLLPPQVIIMLNSAVLRVAYKLWLNPYTPNLTACLAVTVDPWMAAPHVLAFGCASASEY